MFSTYSRVLTTVCALASTAAAVTPIDVKGKDFVDSKTGDRFQIIGVDYQPGDTGGFSAKKDPLSDPKTCLRDATLMQRLGVNTIRVYNLSPELNHDECVSIFNAAGIYMVLDVNSPLEGDNLDRTDPKGSYNAEYFKQVFGVIEGFKNYPNTLAFFSGNEVINEQSSKDVPPYIRAVQRDMKEYIAKHADRKIPVGYSAADVRQILMDTVNYFQCEMKDSPTSGSDFFGLNSYSWCGDSNFQASGYDILTDDFKNASLPVFFSEYGCNAVEPRYFSEVDALYSEKMSQSFSGGLVYEYTQEQNDFGLVKVKDNGDATLLPDFENLRKAFGKLDMDRVHAARKDQTSMDPVECSPDLIKSDDFKSFDIPACPGDVKAMIEKGYHHVKAGKLVDVKKTDLPCAVLDHNGREVKDVKFHQVNDGDSNKPDADASAGETHEAEDENDDAKDQDQDQDKKDDGDKNDGQDQDQDQGKDDKEGQEDKDDSEKSHGTNDKDSSSKDDADSKDDNKDSTENKHSENGTLENSDDSKNDKGTKAEYYDASSAASKSSMSVALLSGAVVMAMFML